jgi:hypothetical protein
MRSVNLPGADVAAGVPGDVSKLHLHLVGQSVSDWERAPARAKLVSALETRICRRGRVNGWTLRGPMAHLLASNAPRATPRSRLLRPN